MDMYSESRRYNDYIYVCRNILNKMKLMLDFNDFPDDIDTPIRKRHSSEELKLITDDLLDIKTHSSRTKLLKTQEANKIETHKTSSKSQIVCPKINEKITEKTNKEETKNTNQNSKWDMDALPYCASFMSLALTANELEDVESKVNKVYVDQTQTCKEKYQILRSVFFKEKVSNLNIENTCTCFSPTCWTKNLNFDTNELLSQISSKVIPDLPEKTYTFGTTTIFAMPVHICKSEDDDEDDDDLDDDYDYESLSDGSDDELYKNVSVNTSKLNYRKIRQKRIDNDSVFSDHNNTESLPLEVKTEVSQSKKYTKRSSIQKDKNLDESSKSIFFYEPSIGSLPYSEAKSSIKEKKLDENKSITSEEKNLQILRTQLETIVGKKPENSFQPVDKPLEITNKEKNSPKQNENIIIQQLKVKELEPNKPKTQNNESKYSNKSSNGSNQNNNKKKSPAKPAQVLVKTQYDNTANYSLSIEQNKNNSQKLKLSSTETKTIKQYNRDIFSYGSSLAQKLDPELAELKQKTKCHCSKKKQPYKDKCENSNEPKKETTEKCKVAPSEQKEKRKCHCGKKSKGLIEQYPPETKIIKSYHKEKYNPDESIEQSENDIQNLNVKPILTKLIIPYDKEKYSSNNSYKIENNKINKKKQENNNQSYSDIELIVSYGEFQQNTIKQSREKEEKNTKYPNMKICNADKCDERNEQQMTIEQVLIQNVGEDKNICPNIKLCYPDCKEKINKQSTIQQVIYQNIAKDKNIAEDKNIAKDKNIKCPNIKLCYPDCREAKKEQHIIEQKMKQDTEQDEEDLSNDEYVTVEEATVEDLTDVEDMEDDDLIMEEEKYERTYEKVGKKYRTVEKNQTFKTKERIQTDPKTLFTEIIEIKSPTKIKYASEKKCEINQCFSEKCTLTEETPRSKIEEISPIKPEKKEETEKSNEFPVKLEEKIKPKESVKSNGITEIKSPRQSIVKSEEKRPTKARESQEKTPHPEEENELVQKVITRASENPSLMTEIKSPRSSIGNAEEKTRSTSRKSLKKTRGSEEENKLERKSRPKESEKSIEEEIDSEKTNEKYSVYDVVLGKIESQVEMESENLNVRKGTEDKTKSEESKKEKTGSKTSKISNMNSIELTPSMKESRQSSNKIKTRESRRSRMSQRESEKSAGNIESKQSPIKETKPKEEKKPLIIPAIVISSEIDSEKNNIAEDEEKTKKGIEDKVKSEESYEKEIWPGELKIPCTKCLEDDPSTQDSRKSKTKTKPRESKKSKLSHRELAESDETITNKQSLIKETQSKEQKKSSLIVHPVVILPKKESQDEISPKKMSIKNKLAKDKPRKGSEDKTKPEESYEAIKKKTESEESKISNIKSIEDNPPIEETRKSKNNSKPKEPRRTKLSTRRDSGKSEGTDNDQSPVKETKPKEQKKSSVIPPPVVISSEKEVQDRKDSKKIVVKNKLADDKERTRKETEDKTKTEESKILCSINCEDNPPKKEIKKSTIKLKPKESRKSRLSSHRELETSEGIIGNRKSSIKRTKPENIEKPSEYDVIFGKISSHVEIDSKKGHEKSYTAEDKDRTRKGTEYRTESQESYEEETLVEEPRKIENKIKPKETKKSRISQTERQGLARHTSPTIKAEDIKKVDDHVYAYVKLEKKGNKVLEILQTSDDEPGRYLLKSQNELYLFGPQPTVASSKKPSK